MNFRTKEEIKKEGFQGFVQIGKLFEDSSKIIDEKGVYLVLYLGHEEPQFLDKDCFESKYFQDNKFSIENLKFRWVKNTIVINIGKAGGKRGNKEGHATLKSRIDQYLSFGKTNRGGHRGGRSIWLIKKNQDLVICWKPTGNEDPRMVEKGLIQEFKAIYGKTPFANLRD